jgi:hypothetical protein
VHTENESHSTGNTANGAAAASTQSDRIEEISWTPDASFSTFPWILSIESKEKTLEVSRKSRPGRFILIQLMKVPSGFMLGEKFNLPLIHSKNIPRTYYMGSQYNVQSVWRKSIAEMDE